MRETAKVGDEGGWEEEEEVVEGMQQEVQGLQCSR